jgi:hypothetical protein
MLPAPPEPGAGNFYPIKSQPIVFAGNKTFTKAAKISLTPPKVGLY